MEKIFRIFTTCLVIMTLAVALTACSSNSNDENQGNQGDSGNQNNQSSTTAPTQQGDQDNTAGYTYNYALSVFPTNWNPHTYQTATDAEILDYTTVGFYTFDYNETKDGYRLVPAMAASEPVDVTAEYTGKYNIGENDTARAWRITLRDDLKWEDGTEINAHSFVNSAKLLLNPDAQNYRADTLYSGNLAITNARNYLYAGQHAYVEPVISEAFDEDEYISVTDVEPDDAGVFTIDGKDIAFRLDDSASWDSDGLEAYYNDDAYKSCFMRDGVDLYETVFQPAVNKEGYIQVTNEIYEALSHVVARLHGAEDTEDYADEVGDYAYQEWEEFCYYGQTYPKLDFSEVGIFADKDNELTLILEKPLQGFYLLYSLADSWLVNEDLYVKSEKLNNGVYTNSYGTSADTYMSYGPYKLASFQADKEYSLVRNDNFYGLTEGQYQTTDIRVALVAEPSTRLEMLLNGTLDTYGLSADDMETYASSDYTYYTTGESTFFMALNPERDALEASQKTLGADYNKTILTLKPFRQALAYALDRSAFALAAAPTNNAAFGIFSGLIISDPETGEAYRTREEAKLVLADFWGLSDEIGDGNMFETVDDAVESITGYNLEMARKLFDEAYESAISEGLMDDNDVVQIMVGTPNSTSDFYNKGYEFLVNCFTDAVVGTALEGKLTFALDDTLGNGFSDALKSNKVDLLFGVGWSGAALDPYGLIEAYTTSNYQYNPRWDTSAEELTVNIDGTDYKASVLEWTQTLSGTEITITSDDGKSKAFKAGSSDNVDEARVRILAALEGAVLETYDLIPMIDDSSASLKGMQIEYYTDEYIYGVGRGGVQYMTYNYNDAEWGAYVSSQGGRLNYN